MIEKKNILGLFPQLTQNEITWIKLVLCRYSKESPIFNKDVWGLELADFALIDVNVLYKGLLITMGISPIRPEEITLKAKIEAYTGRDKPPKKLRAGRTRV